MVDKHFVEDVKATIEKVNNFDKGTTAAKME